MQRGLILVNPPQRGLLDGFPNGLVDLASYVSKESKEGLVSILDLGACIPGQEKSHIQSALLNYDEAPFIGITTTTASYQSAMHIVRTFKAIAPDCTVILGGHHATQQDNIILRHHSALIDVIVRGEGEKALLLLLKNETDLSTVPGISYIRDGEAVRTNSQSQLSTADLDALPVLLPNMNMRSAPGKFDHATYVSARGCPLRCHFCAEAYNQVRRKSPARIIEDLGFLAATGFQRIAIEDNWFARSRERTLRLCSDITKLRDRLNESRSSTFSWDCQTRVESLANREIILAMEQAGCEAVYLGVESLIPRQLNYLGKTPEPKIYLDTLEETVLPQLLESAIEAYINLQLGVPGEDSGERELVLAGLNRYGQLAARRGKSITIFPMLHVIYPGTEHYRQAVSSARYGALGESVFEVFTVWEQEREPILQFLGENFAHGTGGIPEAILSPNHLKQGNFIINEGAVAEIQQYLREMEAIPGIQVFKYGSYLTRTASQADPTLTLLTAGQSDEADSTLPFPFAHAEGA